MAGYYTGIPISESGSVETHRTFGTEPLAPSTGDNDRATGSAHPQETPRPDILQLLENKDHNWSGIVHDYNDCQELTRQYMSIHDKTGDTNVAASNDFPEDKKAQKELARQLFEAILDVDPADAEHMHYKPIGKLSNLEVELLSWELLFATRRAQDGIVGWAKWSSKSSHKYQKCGNFRERFELVKEGCRESKSVVHSMLCAPFIGRLTAAPSHECRLKTANKKINERKGVQLKGYRDIMAEKKPKNDDDPPVPSKRKRKVRDKDEEQQVISKAPDYKRRKVEIPGRSAEKSVIPPPVLRGALSNIPSDPTALAEAEPRKKPSVFRSSCTPSLPGESVAVLNQPFAPSAHQMPIVGAVDVEYPVTQPNPAVWFHPPADFSLPPPVWGPTENFISPYPEGILAALGTGAEVSTVVSNPEEMSAKSGTGAEVYTAVGNPVHFDLFGEWLDFGADA